MFLRDFWGTSSLDCPHAPLMHQQVFFPISHRPSLMGGSTSYLRNSFGELGIYGTYHITKFLSNHYPFLLEAIGANNFGPFPFHAHLRMVQKLLPLDIMACVPPFMWFVEKGFNRFQKSISNRLHDHSFSSIISNMATNSHYTCLKPCMGLGVGV
jgi:hypothetical protein